MSQSKDQSLKWSLLIIIVILGSIIFYKFIPFLSGVLGAMTIYLLVRKQMSFLTKKKGFNKNLSAILILLEILLCILLPTFVVMHMLVDRISSFDLEPTLLLDSVHHLINEVNDKTGYNIMSSDNMSTIASNMSNVLKIVIGEISSFVINSLVLLLFLYFMLLGGDKMENYLYDILPFREKNKRKIINEINLIVRSNAISIPVLALIQGTIAGVGYAILGAPDPAFFGLITCFATIIPLFGTALVWLPLSLYLIFSGQTMHGIGLIAYSLLVISNVDNVARFILQKKIADIHPLITIFGVIIGLSLFGFWGVVFGPLLLSLFLLCFNIFKEDYIDSQK